MEDRIRQAFRIFTREIDRLTRMVSDLLDAARIEAGDLSMTLEPLSLSELARECIQLFEAHRESHPIMLEAEPGVRVLGDATRLHQVLANLLSNAIKYSPAGGEIQVKVAEEGDRILLSVTDQGMGIAPQELERIFEPFRRSGGLKDQIPGVGLGLSVARRIVAGHGGRLTVSSEEGRGATFTVELPLLRAHRPLPAPVAETPSGS
jgi:signal transduction histidine kinase